MDQAFVILLGERGIGEGVLKVLEEQKILSLRVFRAMKEDHIVRLLQCRCMPIGEHALLWELWEKEYSASPRVVREFILAALCGFQLSQAKTFSITCARSHAP